MKKLTLSSILILALFCLKINAQYNFTNYTNKDNVISLKVEGDSIWIGTTGGLVLRNIDGTLIDAFAVEDGLASNFINSIFIDFDDNRWVTGERQDVSNDINGWSVFDYWSGFNRTTKGTYVYGQFSEITQDQDSNMWFGGFDCLFKLQKDDGLYESHSDSFEIYKITAMAVDANNNIWVGQIGDGYRGPYMYDGVKWTDFTDSSGLLSSRINSIKVKDDIVWIATQSGLTKYEGEKFTTYTTDSGLVYNNITDIDFENDTLWVTTTQGVSKFNGTSWTSYNHGNGLPFIWSNTVAVDSNGIKWFATSVGLYSFDNNTWLKYDISDDLFSNAIRDVEIDINGNKWFINTIILL
ncbi:hypothetical protein ACFLTE_09465 [Bacteroidota bacterium]